MSQAAQQTLQHSTDSQASIYPRYRGDQAFRQLRVYIFYFISYIFNFIFEESDKIIDKFCSRGTRRKTLLGLPVKKAVDGAKKGLVITSSLDDKIGVIIHFWFKNSVFHNKALVDVRLVIIRKTATTPAPFTFATNGFLLPNLIVIPRSMRS